MSCQIYPKTKADPQEEQPSELYFQQVNHGITRWAIFWQKWRNGDSRTVPFSGSGAWRERNPHSRVATSSIINRLATQSISTLSPLSPPWFKQLVGMPCSIQCGHQEKEFSNSSFVPISQISFGLANITCFSWKDTVHGIWSWNSL